MYPLLCHHSRPFANLQPSLTFLAGYGRMNAEGSGFMVRDILFAFICTVLVGFFADGWIGSWLNWPDAGAIFAVATMGCFILHAVNKKRGKDDDTNET